MKHLTKAKVTFSVAVHTHEIENGKLGKALDAVEELLAERGFAITAAIEVGIGDGRNYLTGPNVIGGLPR